MLFKDFLKNNAETLSREQILFDWSWPHARYELKVNTRRRITHRNISGSGRIGPWTEVEITELRAFRVLTVTAPKRKIVGGTSVIVITTDDGTRG